MGWVEGLGDILLQYAHVYNSDNNNFLSHVHLSISHLFQHG
jgi:hypothetical protein